MRRENSKERMAFPETRSNAKHCQTQQATRSVADYRGKAWSTQRAVAAVDSRSPCLLHLAAFAMASEKGYSTLE